MSYQPFALKWRPRRFSDVSGQETTVRILRNIVKMKKIPNGLLFTGPRGVGKTTLARIFATAANCPNAPEYDGEPCLDCKTCVDTMSGRNVNFLEIDAASNAGVDDIRKLRQGAHYDSVGSGYKVIFIDECINPSSIVTMGDGSRKMMKLIRKGESVLSWSDERGWEPKRVLRKWNTRYDGRMVKFRTVGRNGCEMTPDHRLIARGGSYFRADDACSVWVRSYELGPVRRSFLKGTLLGDSSFSFLGYPRLALRQSEAQTELMMLKYYLFEPWVGTRPKLYENGGWGDKIWCCNTLTSSVFSEFYEAFYRDGKKYVTEEFLGKPDPIALAAWVMDDGAFQPSGKRFSYVLATHSFSREEIELLRYWLSLISVDETSVYDDSRGRGSRIYVGVRSAELLREIIRPWVPLEMAYKVGGVECGWSLGSIPPVKLGLVETFPRDRVEQKSKSGYVCDIEVEDNHNFLVGDVLVSNCHGITRAGNEALLKVLEEPPLRTVFVLSTTELQRVKETIRSRCMFFQLGGLPEPVIVDRLKYILDREEVTYEEEALRLIASTVTGSIRDAINVAEQATAIAIGRGIEESKAGDETEEKETSSGHVSVVDVQDVLGVAPWVVVSSFADIIVGGDVGPALEVSAELEHVYDLAQFYVQLAWHVRDLLFVKLRASKLARVYSGDDDRLRELRRQSENWTEIGLVYALESLLHLTARPWRVGISTVHQLYVYKMWKYHNAKEAPPPRVVEERTPEPQVEVAPVKKFGLKEMKAIFETKEG